MPLPRVLRVGHQDYSVEALSASRSDDLKAHAMHSPNQATIEIHEGRSPAEQVHLFFHEVLHACWTMFEMGAKATEEEVATKIGKALAIVARANPGLLTALEASLEGAPLLPQPAVVKAGQRRS